MPRTELPEPGRRDGKRGWYTYSCTRTRAGAREGTDSVDLNAVTVDKIGTNHCDFAVLCVVDGPASSMGHLVVQLVRSARPYRVLTMVGLASLGLDRSAHRVRARWTDGWMDITRDSHRR